MLRHNGLARTALYRCSTSIGPLSSSSTSSPSATAEPSSSSSSSTNIFNFASVIERSNSASASASSQTMPIQSALDISPEDIACQLTLIDLTLFKSINRDELTNCLGTCSKHGKKQDLSPHIVAMSKQFNQVTFWVVGQILELSSARARARMISHFIKVARRLRELNNIHSCHAVTSALFSSPIFRLEKTWRYVSKKHPKEKQHLDKLMFFFSDHSNFESLRQHLDTCQLPCIPYLGMYLRDLIYVSTANPVGTPKRNNKMAFIIDAVEKFQQSEYPIALSKHIQAYFDSCRYLDELQKILEDENYRKSLSLEPPETTLKRV